MLGMMSAKPESFRSEEQIFELKNQAIDLQYSERMEEYLTKSDDESDVRIVYQSKKISYTKLMDTFVSTSTLDTGPYDEYCSTNNFFSFFRKSSLSPISNHGPNKGIVQVFYSQTRPFYLSHIFFEVKSALTLPCAEYGVWRSFPNVLASNNIWNYTQQYPACCAFICQALRKCRHADYSPISMPFRPP